MNLPSPARLLDFSGRVVLVTGGGTGIGAGIAVRFAEAGADLAVHYRSSAAGASEVAERIETLGRKAAIVQADVAVGTEVERLMDEAVERLGRLDVLINNAGLYPLAALESMTESEWDAVIDSNLRGTFLCTRAAAKRMNTRSQGGVIVNIASIEGEIPAPMHSHYSAAKAGILMHTRAAALELAPCSIRVNSVSPGLIWRPGIEEDWPDGVERWRQRAPLGRLGRPEDVADACLFLASPAARWITGADLRVDGGIMVSPAF